MSGILHIVLILYCIFEIVHAQQQQCPETNVAVIVVASVFGTLAVVLIVLGIIFFLLWKRRRDISKPPHTPTKKNHLTEDRDIPSPDGGLSNPAFSDGEADLSLIEEGVGGYVRCKEYVSPERKKSPAKSGIINNDPTKKTWTSLPKPDLPPGPTINGSVGSFDDNFLSVDPEVTSVWLQSQDFIGLGFNIAGSMRDGIYISQVHNRGPAIESGKFKVGDRILSVTVSFENMVYEDALTILSYASPYPVKVTLQKEKLTHKDRRISDTHTHLSHPLYRSQSVDTLLKIGRKEPVFQPKRSYSEMKPDSRKESPKNKINEVLQVTLETSENGGNRVTPIRTNSGDGQNIELSEVTVHKANENSKIDMEVVDNVQSSSELVRPEPDVKIDIVNENETDSAQTNITQNVDSKTDPNTELSPTAVEFAELFDKLNEQDKLDMLRLSYEDPNSNIDNSQVIVSAETSFVESSPKSGDASLLDDDPDSKSVPVKPERRKKKSSSNSSVSSADESLHSPSSPRHVVMPPPDDVLVEDVITPVSQATAESAPQQEISEEIITPMKKDRNISILTDKIEFSPVEVPDIQDVSEGSSRDISRTLVDYSLSDMESTLRPPSPETEPPIDEDIIMPTIVKKDKLAASMPGMLVLPDTSINGTKENVTEGNSSSSVSSSDDDKDITQIENTSAEIEKDWTEMALNLKTNPDLFSTPYPSKNMKEGSSGMSYNISMDELNDIETKLRSEIKGPSKRGVAFEVRDDVVSGNYRSVEIDNKIVRPVSYTEKLSEMSEKSVQKCRAGSFKEDLRKCGKDSNDNPLDWSGKRLVRSGSFTDIPQDDSVSDWTDQNALDSSEEHLPLQTSLSSDLSPDNNSNFQTKKPLTKATLFRARENLANLSDNSDSVASVSDPSSRSSTPPPPYVTNGEDNGLGTSPETTPVKSPLVLSEMDSGVNIINTDKLDSGMKINTDIGKSDVIPTVTTKYEGNGAYTVTVTTQQEDDTDC